MGLTKVGNQTKPLKCSEKKKVVFRTFLERMFERTDTDLDTQKTVTQHRLTCDSKVPGCCLMFAAASKIRMIRSSSESTGGV